MVKIPVFLVARCRCGRLKILLGNVVVVIL